MAEPTDGAHHQRDPSLTGKFMLAPAAPPPGMKTKGEGTQHNTEHPKRAGQ